MKDSLTPTIEAMRKAIASALEDGLLADDLLLRVNHRDLALIKRSPAVAIHEVNFKDGEMRFLGVPVAAEAVLQSYLDRTPPAERPVVEPEPVKVKAKAKPRKKLVQAEA